MDEGGTNKVKREWTNNRNDHPNTIQAVSKPPATDLKTSSWDSSWPFQGS